jgi:hypothetical protein
MQSRELSRNHSVGKDITIHIQKETKAWEIGDYSTSHQSLGIWSKVQILFFFNECLVYATYFHKNWGYRNEWDIFLATQSSY